MTTAAEPSALAPIRRAMEAWLAEQEIDPTDGWQIVGACHEACANAAEHAYPPMERGSIEVDARRDGDCIVIRVRDRGRWRPPQGTKGRRGLPLMEYFMDSVDIERSEQGTIVRMERRLDGGFRD